MPIHIPLPILRHYPIQRIAHISPHILIPVLVETKRRARVLHEEVQDANFVVLELREVLDDVVGDEIGAPGTGREGERFLEPGHCGCGREEGCLWWVSRRGGAEGPEEGVEGGLEDEDEDVGEEGCCD